MFSEQNEREFVMVIKVKKLTNKSMLFTADKGIELRNEIYSLVHKEKEIAILKLDMIEIETIDSSFCREAFVKLIGLLCSDTDRAQLLFVNASHNVKDNLHESFTVWDKIGIVVTIDSTFHIIGKSSQPINDTIKVMHNLKKANTKNIADKLAGIPLTTVNNRLKTLYDMCIVTRKEIAQSSGGKEFTYYLET